MLDVLANRTYRHLFAAQIIALVGTGLMTVALGLLAFKLAGARAGSILGTALAIKMIAYVGISPIVSGFAGLLPRRAFLVTMDMIRAAVALLLPFVTEIWQVYVLIFLLQSASAAFTPTFQATIPDVLPDERDYTRALSLSRLAYDLENLLSPMLAAALLTVITFNTLFAGTVLGFLASALLVVSVKLPHPAAAEIVGGIYDKTTSGLHIYLATPRLRGLLALNLCVAAAGAFVIVDTVVLVRGIMHRTDADLALALAAFGGGSMAAALLLPRVLDKLPDRRVMLWGAMALTVLLFLFAVVAFNATPSTMWPALLVTWTLLGAASAAIMTPSGRLLRRSAHPADRPATFAAQFALSHAFWLVTYPLAGWLGSQVGMGPTVLILAIVTVVGTMAAARLWPASDPETIEHSHENLPADHAHLRGTMGRRHKHAYVIDALHQGWPQTDAMTAIGAATNL